MGLPKKVRMVGKCVYTTAKEATLREWYSEQPEVGTDKELRESYCVGLRYESLTRGSIVARQAWNGSIRLVYAIHKREGGGAFRPFVFPASYPTHKSLTRMG